MAEKHTFFFFFLGNTNFQKLITFHNSKTTAVFKRRSSGSADFLSLHSKLNQQIIKINPLLNLPLWRTLNNQMYFSQLVVTFLFKNGFDCKPRIRHSHRLTRSPQATLLTWATIDIIKSTLRCNTPKQHEQCTKCSLTDPVF